jgi:hypothetical protein
VWWLVVLVVVAWVVIRLVQANREIDEARRRILQPDALLAEQRMDHALQLANHGPNFDADRSPSAGRWDHTHTLS